MQKQVYGIITVAIYTNETCL